MRIVSRVLFTLVFIGLAVSGLVYFYLNTERVDLTKSNRLIDRVNDIVLESAKWDTEILRINNGLSMHEDDFVYDISRIESALQELSADPKIHDLSVELEQTIREKSNFVALFSSEISVLQTALTTLPILYQRLLASDEIQQSEFDEKFLQLFTLVANYSMTSSSYTLQDIKQHILIVENDLLNTDLSFEQQDLLYQFLAQVGTIMVVRPDIDNILVDIQILPITQQTNQISQIIRDDVAVQMSEQDKNKAYLTYYAAALLLVLSILAIRLLSNYFRLESMVEKRTEDLQVALENLKNSEMMLVQTEKMSALGQLVAGVVHEVNTPLAYTKNALELTQSNMEQLELKRFVNIADLLVDLISNPNAADVAEQKRMIFTEIQNMRALMQDQGLEGIRYADIVDEISALIQDGITGVDQISNLVSNLRNFSRLDRGSVARHSLSESIQSTLALLKYELKNTDVEVLYEDDCVIECMPSQINQVLLNIIGNANHATGDKGEITITLRRLNLQYAGIYIRDNGMGIAPEQLKDIFNPFYTTKKVGEGTGLGLSISHKIIKEHGGSIEVQSTVGEGTEFLIKLPFRLTKE